MIASSAGVFGGVWAQAELRKVLGAMGARVTEVEVAVGQAAEKFNADGRARRPRGARSSSRDALQTARCAEVPADAG